jgi:hypothetical protein
VSPKEKYKEKEQTVVTSRDQTLTNAFHATAQAVSNKGGIGASRSFQRAKQYFLSISTLNGAIPGTAE